MGLGFEDGVKRNHLVFVLIVSAPGVTFLTVFGMIGPVCFFGRFIEIFPLHMALVVMIIFVIVVRPLLHLGLVFFYLRSQSTFKVFFVEVFCSLPPDPWVWAPLSCQGEEGRAWLLCGS